MLSLLSSIYFGTESDYVIAGVNVEYKRGDFSPLFESDTENPAFKAAFRIGNFIVHSRLLGILTLQFPSKFLHVMTRGLLCTHIDKRQTQFFIFTNTLGLFERIYPKDKITTLLSTRNIASGYFVEMNITSVMPIAAALIMNTVCWPLSIAIETIALARLTLLICMIAVETSMGDQTDFGALYKSGKFPFILTCITLVAQFALGHLIAFKLLNRL